MKIFTDIQILYVGLSVISSFISGDMTPQSFFRDKGTSHSHPIFTPGESAKIRRKSHFMPENVFSHPNSYYPILLQLQQPPGGSILTKFCQNVP